MAVNRLPRALGFFMVILRDKLGLWFGFLYGDVSGRAMLSLTPVILTSTCGGVLDMWLFNLDRPYIVRWLNPS